MKEERGWVMRQREKERGRRREWKTSLWWWWDLFRPGSFDVSVTGAPEPGTGSLVKHATTHLPRHHSLPLFPSDSPLSSPAAFPSLFFAQPRFSISFYLHPFSRFSLVESSRRAPNVPSSFSSLLFALLLAFIEIHPCIPFRGVSLGAPFELLIMRYFRRTENFFGTEWKIWWLVFFSTYIYIRSGVKFQVYFGLIEKEVELINVSRTARTASREAFYIHFAYFKLCNFPETKRSILFCMLHFTNFLLLIFTILSHILLSCKQRFFMTNMWKYRFY